MNRKLYLSVIVVLILAGFAVNPTRAAKNYFAEKYDVVVAVQSDGALIVSETVVYYFEGGPFTYVFRHLNLANLDEIDRLQASMDGQVLSQGTQAGQVEIAAGRPLKVTWHFAPTSDARHEFGLTYRVSGAIRRAAAADALLWRAIPESHDYTIARSIIRLEYPANNTPLSTPTLHGVPAGSITIDQAIVFTTQQIGADTPVDLKAEFPLGSLVGKLPVWQLQQQQQGMRMRTALPYGFSAAILVGIVGMLGIMLMGRSFHRQETAQSGVFQSISTPPQSIAPALPARLIGSDAAFLGTLFDLARRGLLCIEERPKRWGGRVFEVVRQPSGEILLAHEQAFLGALFHKAKNDRVVLSQIAMLASHHRFTQALEEEIAAAGWRDEERSARRTRYLTLAGVAALLGGAGFVMGLLLFFAQPSATWLSSFAALLSGAGVAMSGAGLLALILASLVSTLSEEGARQAAAWKNFALYLRNITRRREPAASPALFERYLPYAASFGMANEWAKFFEKLADVPVPAWFHGLQPGLDDGSFIAVMAAVLAADSSASAASAASSGASGGGASGAG